MPRLQTWVAAWVAALRAAGKTDRTIESYRDLVDRLVASLPPGNPRDALTTTRIRAYLGRYAETHATASVALATSAIRSFVQYLVEAEALTVDPMLRIRAPKARKSLPDRGLDSARVQQLLSALDPPGELTPAAAWHWQRNRRFVLILLYTGLRLSEGCDLRWGDVDLDSAVLVVRGGKGKKDRAVPIHPILCTELRAAPPGRPEHAICGKPNGQPLTPKSAAHIFERWLVDQAHLGYALTAHQLRHTFCTALIQTGAPLFDVQAMMGHEDPKTTRQYYRLVAHGLHAAIARLAF